VTTQQRTVEELKQLDHANLLIKVGEIWGNPRREESYLIITGIQRFQWRTKHRNVLKESLYIRTSLLNGSYDVTYFPSEFSALMLKNISYETQS
jgi:hypothetical protein